MTTRPGWWICVAAVGLVFLFRTSFAVAETQVRNATSASSATSEAVGTFEGVWNNVTDIACESAARYVWLHMQPLQRSELIVVRGFGFNVPQNATIDAIRVTWIVRIGPTNPTLNKTRAHEVALVRPFTPGSPPPRYSTPREGSTVAGWNSTWSPRSYPLDGDNVMWTIPPSDDLRTGTGVSDQSFGISMSVNNLNLQSMDVMIQCVTIEVDFTPPQPTSTGTTTTTTGNTPATTAEVTTGVGSTTGRTTGEGMAVTTAVSVPSSSTTARVTSSESSAPASSETATAQSPQFASWAIVGSAIGILACTVISAAAWTWYMGRRRKLAMDFARGVGLPRADPSAPPDDSESDPGSALDGDSTDSSSGSALSYPRPLSTRSFARDDTDGPHYLSNISIKQSIGHGHFGEVFLGRWCGSTDIACKTLPGAGVGGDAILEEAVRLQELNHPNIVRYYGLYRQAGYKNTVFIIMEYMSMGALDSYLASAAGRLNETVTSLTTLCIDVAAGMRYLSEMKVVHGDLAARNLLVKQDDGRVMVKIADFGLSMLADSGHDRPDGEQYCRIPEGVARKFATKYSAPEVIEERRFSIKSDVWAFGIVMWEVYSRGERPYGDMSNDEALKYVSFGQRLMRPAECPVAMFSLMLKCWATRPTARPSFPEIHKRLVRELRTTSAGLEYNNVLSVMDTGRSGSFMTVGAGADASSSGVIYHTSEGVSKYGESDANEETNYQTR